MNFHRPRQIGTGPNAGKWHYTCYNDNQRQTWPEGYCAQGRCAHDTAEEAIACKTRYDLDHMLRFHQDRELKAGVTLQECAECQAVCTGFADIGPSHMRQIYLCVAHRNRETVEKHYKAPEESFGSY